MKSPFPQSTYHHNASIYKIMANPKRLEILNILKKDELSVEALIRIMKVSKSNMSQHLAVLRHAGLVRTKRDGLNVYYSLVDTRIVTPCRVFHDLRLGF